MRRLPLAGLVLSSVSLMLACGGAEPPVEASCPEPSSGAAVGPRYPIALERPETVGERYVVDHWVGQRFTVRATRPDGATREQARYREVRFVAQTRVTDANARGATERDYRVRLATLTEHGQAQPLVPEGATLHATLGAPGRPGRLTSDVPVTPEVGAHLQQVITFPGGRDPFSTTEERAVGERWSGDHALLEQELLEEVAAMHTEDTEILSQAMVVRVEEVDGVECVVVATEVRASPLDPAELPPGAEGGGGHMQIQHETAWPRDGTTGMLRQALRMRLVTRVVGTRPDGTRGTVETEIEREERVRYQRSPSETPSEAPSEPDVL